MGVARKPFELHIQLKSGVPVILDNVEEYVSGFKYLYVRTSSLTLSYHRDAIQTVSRRMNSSDPWTSVPLRHPANWRKDNKNACES